MSPPLLPEQVAFLVGAGISVDPPTRFPTALRLVDTLLTAIAPTQEWLDRLRALAVPGSDGRRGGCDFIRFELLLEVIQELVDPELVLLDVIDLFQHPNDVHDLVAGCGAQGAALLTTNFDSLLERSLLDRSCRPWTICSDEQFRSWPDGLADGAIPVIKLHGSAHRYEGKRTVPARSTIQATVDGIASRWAGFSLPDAKRRVLGDVTAGKTLVVAGYSGTDDFDVVPTLHSIMPSAVVWIVHSNEDDVRDVTREEAARLRSASGDALSARDTLWRHLERAAIPWRILRGRTRLVLASLFSQPAPAERHGAGATPGDLAEGFVREWANRRLTSSFRKYAIVGDLLRRLGRSDLAQQALRRAWQERNDGLDPDVALAAFFLSRACTDRNDVAEALEWAERAVAALTPESRPRTIALCFHQRGYASYWGEDPAAAREWYARARAVAAEHDFTALVSVCTHDAALILQDEGRFDDAIAEYRHSIELSSQIGDLRHVAFSLHQIGTASYTLGRFAESERSHRAAKDIAVRIGDTDQLGKSLSELGTCRFVRGDLVGASRLFHRAARLARATNPRFEPVDWQHVGQCYLEAGRLERAERYFRRAEQLYESAGDTVTITEVRCLIAECLIRGGRYRDAAAITRLATEQCARLEGLFPEYAVRARFTAAVLDLVCANRPEEEVILAQMARARDGGFVTLLLDQVQLCALLKLKLGRGAAPFREHALEVFGEVGNERRTAVVGGWWPE